MNVVAWKTPGGEDVVTLSRRDYDRLVDAAEMADDIAAFDKAKAALAAGEDEIIPSQIASRLLDGTESRIRVWREFRGLTMSAVAREAGIAPAYLSEIETGKKEPSLAVARKLAAALRVTLDDSV